MSLARHSLIYLCGRLLTGLVGLASLLVLTRAMSPSAYGEFSVVVAVSGMVAGVMFQWLRQSLVQFAPSWPNRSQLTATVWCLFGATYVLLLIAAATLSFTFEQALDSVGLPTVAVVAVCLLSLAQAFFELAQDAVRIDMRPMRFGLAAIARSVVSLLCAAVAALYWKTATAVVVATAVGYVLAGMLSAPRWLLGEWRDSRPSSDAALASIRYGLPLCLTLGMVFIVDSSDRLMLFRFSGEAETGVYSAAYNFSQFSIGTLLAGLTLASYPLLVRTYANEGLAATQSLLGRNLLFSLAVGVPGVVGLAILADDLGRVMLGNYVQGTTGRVVAIVAVAIGLAAIRTSCFDSILMVVRRTRAQMAIMCGAAMLNVVLNLLLIPGMGALGAAWSTLAAFAAALLASAVCSMRFIKTPVNLRAAAAIAISALAMGLVLTGLGAVPGGILVVITKVTVGAVVYLVALVATAPVGWRRNILGLARARILRSKDG